MVSVSLNRWHAVGVIPNYEPRSCCVICMVYTHAIANTYHQDSTYTMHDSTVTLAGAQTLSIEAAVCADTGGALMWADPWRRTICYRPMQTYMHVCMRRRTHLLLHVQPTLHRICTGSTRSPRRYFDPYMCIYQCMCIYIRTLTIFLGLRLARTLHCKHSA